MMFYAVIEPDIDDSYLVFPLSIQCISARRYICTAKTPARVGRHHAQTSQIDWPSVQR